MKFTTIFVIGTFDVKCQISELFTVKCQKTTLKWLALL